MLAHPTHERLIALGLAGMAKAFQEQCASPDLGTLSFEERIGILADREAAERDTKRMATRLRFASLRHAACVEDIDLRAPRGIDRQLLARLITGDWIDKRQNCLITGPTGVGKSWELACALGHKACRDGRSVSYQRVPRLFEALALARSSDGRTWLKCSKQSPRHPFSLILDDWGLLRPHPSHNASISWRSSKTETAMVQPSHHTSQIPIDKWHEVIADPTLADAILDRIVHNAHRLNISGESMRKLSARNILDAD